MKNPLLLGIAASVWALAAGAAMAQTAPAPAAASNRLVEVHGDWQVVCADKNRAAQTCSFLQEQATKTGQHLVAVELRPSSAGLTGSLVMPFGLELPRGVTLQIDATTPTPPVAFATCIYTGCIAQLSFNRTQVAALRKGTDLKISAFANDGTPINLTVPLKGFAEAEDRTGGLIAGPAAAAPKPAAAAPATLQ